MKVLVVGANGGVAKHFANFVVEHPSIEEKAVIRNAEQARFFEARGIETVLLDIVYDSIEDFTTAMRDVDAVVFSAGAAGSGLDKTVMIDFDGAIKFMTAAEMANVQRFIMVSTFQTGRDVIAKQIKEDASLKIYTIAKYYADDWLKNRTNLDWTIIHPGILTNTAGSGTIKVGQQQSIQEISREDVAEVVLRCLENKHSIGKEFEILAGSIPVAEAIASI